MTQSACSADRGGDGPQSTQGGSGTSTSPDTHLSLDGGWDSALSLAGVARLDLANMDGTEPLKHAQNVRELRLERVSGSMEVSRALTRLTIVDSPIACANPQGRDLPNLAEVAVQCSQTLHQSQFKMSCNWGLPINLIQNAQELRKLKLVNSHHHNFIQFELPSLYKLETLQLCCTKGSLHLLPNIQSIILIGCKITKFQCDVDSLPDMRQLIMECMAHVDISLSQILHKAPRLGKLQLGMHLYIVTPLPDMSKLKVLDTLNLENMKGEISLQPSIRSITLTRCKITKLQYQPESLPDLRQLTVYNAFSAVACLGEQLQTIVQISPMLQKLKLENNYMQRMLLPDISRLTVLEFLTLAGMEGDIYLPPSIRSVSIEKCKITKFSCDTETLPNLLELTINYMRYVDPSLTMVLQKAIKVQNLIIYGWMKGIVYIGSINLQPSVTILKLQNICFGELILVGTPGVKNLLLNNVGTHDYRVPVLIRLIKSRTISSMQILNIGLIHHMYGVLCISNLNFVFQAFIQRDGVDARIDMVVGRYYIQRGKTMYQKTNSVEKIVVLPANLVAFVYRQKIIPLARQLTMLVQTLLE
eukprot:EST46260.1 hypothetical protein SS50377_13736 [Spironucleus salmonicida]